MSDAVETTTAGTKTRRVGTFIDAEAGKVVVTYNHQPIGEFDVALLPDAPPAGIVRDLAVFAAGTLMARAANLGDDPAQGVQDMLDRLVRGEWSPGKRRVQREPDAIVVALAQHLGQSTDYISDTYLPRYCRAQGHVMVNGRLMLANAKRELERHEKLAPIVAKIIAQRAKQMGAQKTTIDLESLADDSGDEMDHAEQPRNAAE